MNDLDNWLATTQQRTMLSGSSENRPLMSSSLKGKDPALKVVKSYDAFSGSLDNIAGVPHELSSEELYAKQCGLESPEKTIDELGSLSLMFNNVVGPAMMSLPQLFQTAGILPTSAVIAFCSVSSSLCGTFLADAISSVPGNSNFDQDIEFGTAFRRIIGDDAYYIAEILFLMSCMVQAVAGLIEAAQGTDGFLASFIFGKTYALQLYPEVEVISWGADACADTDGDGVGDQCLPFVEDGPIIISLGYVLCALGFHMLSRGFLQEIIWVQILVVVVSLILLLQFEAEFWQRGFDVEVPWVGNEFGRLAGVVLFNFAFSITVPTWLKEKKTSVDVNTVVWSSSLVSAWIYIAFGITAAASFANVDSEILKQLASPQTSYLTRIAAAVFGVTIIGCGVPVFCVMIKSALYSSRLTGAGWAFFWGAVFPYVFSFLLYQGSILMEILNWTGLLVNGAVAFILPLTLALYTLEGQKRKLRNDAAAQKRRGADGTVSSSHSPSRGIEGITDEVARMEAARLGIDPEALHTPSIACVSLDEAMEDPLGEEEDHRGPLLEEEFAMDGTVYPLPAWLAPHRYAVLIALLASLSIIIGATIVVDVATGTLDE